MIFDYPQAKELRCHGPVYSAYESYRPWLQDEFLFRCAYCLKRETWGQATSEYEIDHFKPQSLAPQLKLDYANLVYSCRVCNSVKGDQTVQDPLRLLCSDLVAVMPDGSLRTRNRESERLIRQLDLNSPRRILWRTTWMDIVQLARNGDAELCSRLIGFPKDLPDLRGLNPASNTREEGVADCWYERRKRGELPDEY